MRNPHQYDGFEDAVLRSNEDYEPYGYAQPQLASHAFAGAQLRERGLYERDRVIEAAVLARLGAAG